MRKRRNTLRQSALVLTGIFALSLGLAAPAQAQAGPGCAAL